MGPRLPALTLAAALLLVAGACSSSSAASASPRATSTPSPGCRAEAPEAGVWQPDRLQVLKPCQRAAGVVVQVIREPDGDRHVWFRVDAGYESLLNAENHFQGKPALLGEITPDCPLATNPPDANAAAECPATDLPIPGPGDHIDIYGPWVLDLDHGWNEIHPVDSIVISDAG
ncbi:MAG: hypothetical protein E6H97_06785 [Chloroflexi bacterium]|nr:MAG: hypothetical protein E6H97_06785 [Chloroflexota bacterium]